MKLDDEASELEKTLQTAFDEAIIGRWLAFVIVSSILILVKTLFYLRVFNNFGILVDLVIGVFGKIISFSVFLIMMIFFYIINFHLFGETF